MWQYKIDQVKTLSKIGRFGETFSRNWKKIPAGIKEKCSAAELAEMVDVLYEQYKKEE